MEMSVGHLDQTPTPVVACVIKPDPGDSKPPYIDKPHFLMGRRLDEHAYGGLWEFPGGKIDPGETLREAATREILEELGLHVLTVSPVPLFVVTIPNYIVTFIETYISGMTKELTAHSVIEWLPLAAMEHYPMTPASAAYVIHLLQKK